MTTTTTKPACYVTGPRVPNEVFEVHCTADFSDLEDAQQQCTLESNCTFLHDFNCDASGWRRCNSDISAALSQSNGTGACTKIPQPCTTTVTTTTAMTTTVTTATVMATTV